MPEEVEEDNIEDNLFFIIQIEWLRPGIFSIIYNDSDFKQYLTIRDLANSKTLYFDNKIREMKPFGYRGTEVKYLIVLKVKEIYCLDLETFEKSIIDTL